MRVTQYSHVDGVRSGSHVSAELDCTKAGCGVDSTRPCSRRVTGHPPTRWKALKAQLTAERTKLGDCADLKQFYRDLEELKEWISEKLPTACDESYKDPTNIQASPPRSSES